VTKDLIPHRRRSAGLADLLYAPDQDQRPPELRLCTPPPAPTARPAIRHLAHSFVKNLDGTHDVASTTYSDSMLDQITAHVDDHPEDARATLDALLRALHEASHESHARRSHRVA
jgi:hypothetical protein